MTRHWLDPLIEQEQKYLDALVIRLQTGKLTSDQVLEELELWAEDPLLDFLNSTHLDERWVLPFKVAHETYGTEFMRKVLSGVQSEGRCDPTIISFLNRFDAEFTEGKILFVKLVKAVGLGTELISFCDEKHRTSLHLACQSAWKYDADIIELLVDISPSPSLTVQDDDGNTPIHSLSLYDTKWAEVFVLQIEKAVNLLSRKEGYETALTMVNKKGRTPLHEACININDVKSITALLSTAEGMAATSIRDLDGKTPYDHFVAAKYIEGYNDSQDIEVLKTRLLVD